MLNGVSHLRSPPRADTEADLIARALRRDEAAVRELIRRNNQRLFRTARAILGNDTDAEDVVQETYLHAFTRLDSFRRGAAFSTWLTRIAVNEALMRLRQSRRASDTEVASLATDGETELPVTPPATRPDAMLARREIIRLIEAAIDALPAPFRPVIMLRDVEGLSISETAAALNLKPATVKTRLHRARHLVRAALDETVAASLNEAFPFAGRRCNRTADRVVLILCQ